MSTKLILSFFLLLNIIIVPQKTVYIVLGSDTALWDNMDVSKYNCYYNIQLFSDATQNTAKVMDPLFRARFTDSFGSPVKLTWWMMGGNIFRFATNNNVPSANSMTLHLMKKYHGNRIAQWGDELSIHYHTFSWTDYDLDGVFWWNQAKSFNETKDDFNVTLAQYLLEEDSFPVSFRSGWHYMDNNWQNYINTLFPYSLHNDYPAIHNDPIEPIDNNYDWSQSSAEFVPFNPSPTNYQLAGNSKGWNVRSKYMGSVTQTMMNTIFQKANAGTEQLACFWSHLPEVTFLTEIQLVDSLAHKAALLYPNVKFKYCTATEAYQLWRKSTDTTKPVLTLSEEISGDQTKIVITSNEKIFQQQPFVAVKDIYERFTVEPCVLVSENTWKTVNSFSINTTGKIGVAITDTIGNLSTAFINYLPDDKFIDNNEPGYAEIYGAWSTSTSSAWGLNSRIATLNTSDSAKISWSFIPSKTTYHSIFTQFPNIANQIDTINFSIKKDGIDVISLKYSNNSSRNLWSYISTLVFDAGQNYTVEMKAKNTGTSAKILCADVIKFSAFVRDRQLLCDKQFLDMGELSVEDTLFFSLKLSNAGINNLSVQNVTSVNGEVMSTAVFPVNIPGMNSISVPLIFVPQTIGTQADTIIIASNDPIKPFLKIPFTVNVEPYFKIIDNDDSASYIESGAWFKSVAQAYGTSSRCVYLVSPSPQPYADFSTLLKKTGLYDVYFIVPVTVNGADNALYILMSGSTVLDSVHANQNTGSGVWKLLGRYQLPNNQIVTLRVIDSGESTVVGVLRADAVRFSFVDPSGISNDEKVKLPIDYQLFQNYPNPFNPSTVVSYALPVAGFVSLTVYDNLGRIVKTLVREEQSAGLHEVNFNASDLSSGIYFVRFEAGKFSKTMKMILIK